MALTPMKIANATITKSIMLWMNLPYAITTAGTLPLAALRVMAKSLKSTPPISRPIGGMTTSPTNDETILPKAAPMMIPTAMSTTLPLTAKALNSLSTPIGYFLVTDEVGERSVNQQNASCSTQLLTSFACYRPAHRRKVYKRPPFARGLPPLARAFHKHLPITPVRHFYLDSAPLVTSLCGAHLDALYKIRGNAYDFFPWLRGFSPPPRIGHLDRQPAVLFRQRRHPDP